MPMHCHPEIPPIVVSRMYVLQRTCRDVVSKVSYETP